MKTTIRRLATVRLQNQNGTVSDSDAAVSRRHGGSGVRLPGLMDLYIHPLYVLVSKILSSILNSFAPIHPLYHPLSTLSTVRLTYQFI
jgi:hypothetical protein